MKNFTFFVENEDLLSVIKKTLEDNSIDETHMEKISTGWTNIVFDVPSKGENYIFRFPRNDFFSKRMIVDAKACQFYRERINLETINLQLCFDEKNRPFSVHKKLAGVDLSNRINVVENSKKNKIIKDIASCYHRIHTIPLDKGDPNELRETFLDFINELAKVDDNYYDYSKHDIIKKLKNGRQCYIHGDLNIRNVLLNERDEIAAFLDYSFCTISSPYIDLARMAPAVDEDFLDRLIFEYESLSSENMERNILQECIIMWKYIEEQYIVYMKKFFPEIKL